MMEFLVEVSPGRINEISGLVTSLSWTDKLNDGCSKMEFSFYDDGLNIENGSRVRFRFDNSNIFYGRVFKYERGKKGLVNITAYDQLRYAKARDTFVSKNDTVTTLIDRMCNYLKMDKGFIADAGKYILKTKSFQESTWLDIIYSGINETLTNMGKWYSLRDEYGLMSLRNIEDLKLDLILGDESLCYDFNYGKSIDDSFYNLIKIHVKGNPDIYTDDQIVIKKDVASMEKYGPMQYFEVAADNTNVSQAKVKADILLSLYNHETLTLTLDCLGDTRVRAGSSFYGSIEDIKLDRRLIVRSVTHKFLPVHTMQIEVAL